MIDGMKKSLDIPNEYGSVLREAATEAGFASVNAYILHLIGNAPEVKKRSVGLPSLTKSWGGIRNQDTQVKQVEHHEQVKQDAPSLPVKPKDAQPSMLFSPKQKTSVFNKPRPAPAHIGTRTDEIDDEDD